MACTLVAHPLMSRQTCCCGQDWPSWSRTYSGTTPLTMWSMDLGFQLNPRIMPRWHDITPKTVLLSSSGFKLKCTNKSKLKNFKIRQGINKFSASMFTNHNSKLKTAGYLFFSLSLLLFETNAALRRKEPWPVLDSIVTG